MPAGYEITAHSEGGRLWLRASAVLGLLGIAVFSAENKGEQIPGPMKSAGVNMCSASVADHRQSRLSQYYA